MNGRVYDPTTARFLSADPHIQAPYDTQSYNRYSYVKNNPLKYTDPSGFFFKKFFKAIKKVVLAIDKFTKKTDLASVILLSKPVRNFFVKYKWARVVLSIVASWFGGPLGGMHASMYLTDIQGGNNRDIAKAALISLASSFIASEIGDSFGHDASFLSENGGGSGYASASSGYTNAAIKAVVHGISRAAIAKAQGQDTSSAFWSGFVSSGFAAPDSYGEIGGTVVTIVVGGTVSEISGGKFANGAVTAAYIHLFNAEAENMWKNYRDPMPVALGSREGPTTPIGRIVAKSIEGGIAGAGYGFATGGPAKSLAYGAKGLFGGGVYGAAKESNLNIDSIDKKDVIKFIIEKNKEYFK